MTTTGLVQDNLKRLYFQNTTGSGCTHDHGLLTTLAVDKEWKRIIDSFAKQLHEGKWSEGKIPAGIYFKTASTLAEALVGANQFAYDDPRNSLAATLRANLYQFSGAKSLTEAAAFTELLLDENGELKSFNRFRSDMEALHGLYNEQYLSAEYHNAVAQAQAANQWKQWEKSDTWLEYRTMLDDRVREKHRLLEGLVLHVSSPVWNRIYPPNDWLCRCVVVPAPKPKNPVSEQEAGKLGKDAVTNPLFDNNPGKTGIIFKADHPYFESVKGIRELDAVRNYGLKSAEKIMQDADRFPAISHMDTETDYYIWWERMVAEFGVGQNNFVLPDKLGSKLLFTASPDGKKKGSYFRDHILGNDEKRYEYAASLVDIVTDPDEVWYNRQKGVLSAIYVKYFSDAPYVVRTEVEEKVIRAQTIHKADKKEVIGKLRKGALVYKK